MGKLSALSSSCLSVSLAPPLALFPPHSFLTDVRSPDWRGLLYQLFPPSTICLSSLNSSSSILLLLPLLL
ncbi:hypothetical protein PNOK_0083900 [Pyrrhoderma noxium]|uniref:Uncharacterized protein n=1 Tax=Pyrrhoderma noxium TaxID=2282107 RepID=A0A286UW24_9AGAM|nr:hypothetical protein PNOK_0083900 [Pyrrhoderma noxium]